MFGRLALDVIGRAGFSLDLGLSDEQKSEREENQFLFHTKKFFTGRIQSWKFIIMGG